MTCKAMKIWNLLKLMKNGLTFSSRDLEKYFDEVRSYEGQYLCSQDVIPISYCVLFPFNVILFFVIYS